MKAKPEVLPGELADRFELVETYAGGEGFTARVRCGDQDAVLKILDPGERPVEATLLASLAHPAIPRIREVGTLEDGRSWMLRDWVAGEPLSSLVPLTPEQAVDLATQVLTTLAYVHLRGVQHLDLKPGNLVRGTDGTVQVLDFGLGGRRGERARGGTLFFAAPELLMGLTPDARSDLFSLGAVLVACLWPGEKGPPLSRFLQSFPEEDFFRACGREAAGFPPPFDDFLPRLLARRPQRRFPDAQAALEFLSGGSGRPELGLLRPDPIAVHGEAAAAAAAMAPEHDIAIVGGTAEDRRLLALHLACGSGREVRIGEGIATVVRGGGEAIEFRIPELSAAQVEEHLREVLGLDERAASAAAAWLLAREGNSASALGNLLVGLVEEGSILPDGARWVWPDAASGRLAAGPGSEPRADAEGIGAAARGGRPEQAEALFRRATSEPGVDERRLRRALVEGFLAAGEPARALPLCHDLPVQRLQALFDMGRTAEAESLLESVSPDDPEGARRLHRLRAQLHFVHGELAEAEELLADLLAKGEAGPEERISMAIVLENSGELEAARTLCLELLRELDESHQPYLCAAARISLAQIERRLGNLEDSRAVYRRAQALLFRSGHVRHAATAVLNLGVVEKDLGLWTEAVAHLRQSRALHQHVRDATGAAIAEANLGIVELESGDPAGAERRLTRAAADLRRLGSRRAESLARVMLARAQAEQGRADAARESLVEAGSPDSARLREEVARVQALLAEPAAAPTPTHADSEGSHTDEDMSEGPVRAAGDGKGISRELFRTFLAVNRRLASESDLERAMDHLLDAALTLTGGRRGYLLLARPDGLRQEFQAGEGGASGKAFSRSLANRAMQEQRTLTGQDALADRGLAEMPSIRNLEVRSAVCAPFHSATGATGAIYVEHAGRTGVFGEQEKEHLEMLADQAAIATDRMLREEQLSRELQQSRRELAVVKRAVQREPTRLIGESKPMLALRQQIEKLAQLDLAVLILGDTGTGKELVARSIHESGPRRRGPFVAENCAALPAELMERELFGHVKGAFTGADQDRPGLLELAHGGTLFLDEVGDMPPALQAKLLRALQEQAIRRIGGTETTAIDLRLLTATHRDLKAMVSDGGFREDLYYRIAAVEIRIPPLRERKGDVTVLARHFLDRFNREHRGNRSFSKEALTELEDYSWPGNVRELEHVVARACLLANDDVVRDLDLPKGEARAPAPPRGGSWPVMTLQEAEHRTILAALEDSGGDKTKAAKTLGISRTALYEKLKRNEKRAKEKKQKG